MRDPYLSEGNCEEKENETMDFPETKYEIGAKLYFLNGAQCLPFTVSAITYVHLADGTWQYAYKFDDIVSKKPIQAFEPQLVSTWEEAKAAMKVAIDQAVENAYKQLEAVVDPYQLPTDDTKE